MDEGFAKAMERKLAEYYKEPVKRVSEYCDAFRNWQKVLVEDVAFQEERLKDLPQFTETYDAAMQYPNATPEQDYWLVKSIEQDIRQKKEVISHLNALYIPIYKSNFLARHVYDREPLRTVRCPEHQGRWSGCTWGDDACEYGCMYGSNVTGWLPEPHEYVAPPPDRPVIKDDDGKIVQYGITYNQDRCYQCGGTKVKGLHDSHGF